MNDLCVAPARAADLPVLLPVYDTARRYMRETGNLTQWTGGYPGEDVLLADISAGALYLVRREAVIVGVFAFYLGEEPTYAKIEGGRWSCDAPYGYIHRVASAGICSGITRAAFDFALGYTDYLRIDTHADNRPMQTALARYGFTRCGVIRLQNGDPRIAFDYQRRKQA